MNKKLYDLMDWAGIEAIVYSEEDHPERLLGAHKVRGGYLVQAFLPGAEKVFVKGKDTGKRHAMEKADDAGFFAVLVAGKKLEPYTYVVTYEDGTKAEKEDPYLYTDLFGANDLKRFGSGIHYSVYEYLGAHTMAVSGCMDDAEARWDAKKASKGEVYGTHFAVWAPNAMRVSVVGDFNRWDGSSHPMCRLGDSGVFALFLPGVEQGEIYKYEIKVNYNTVQMKTDPYGFACEQRPSNASVVTNLTGYSWGDSKWLAQRKKAEFEEMPVSVYEVHLGSWMKKEYQTEEPTCEEQFYNYRELAPLLTDYVQKMHYTHVELMPIMEHPLDESWGYQVTGYYAVTSRYGSPRDFMFFVDYLHQHGIGVILDWVPAHFPKDANGLARFDGTCLYEHLDPRQGEHPHWGTLIYNYGRPQVANFLIANALFWVKQYHADGIRMDAVASMLYLDYGKQDGEWIPNIYGGNENLEAIALLQNLSKVFHKECAGAWLIAEESTAWPKVTGEVSQDGLGFDLKWNMGWMNDFISYMQTDPLFRKGRHGMLTFSMIYAYSEKFMLVLSHDEVVHMKGSMLTKMPGTMEEKFANLRAAYGFMMAHPGKKLLFMGQEFGQTTEWNEKISLPWEEAKEPEHKKLQTYVRHINQFYKKHPALYQLDHKEEGFEWLSNMDADHSIVTFMRYSKKEPGEKLLVVCNFTPVLYENFKVGVPFPGKYKEIFNSDDEEFGGTGHGNRRQKNSKPVEWDGREDSISIEVPPLSVCVFRCVGSES
jgi:1,4-alpha-glucan branching enzyme